MRCFGLTNNGKRCRRKSKTFCGVHNTCKNIDRVVQNMLDMMDKKHLNEKQFHKVSSFMVSIFSVLTSETCGRFFAFLFESDYQKCMYMHPFQISEISKTKDDCCICYDTMGDMRVGVCDNGHSIHYDCLKLCNPVWEIPGVITVRCPLCRIDIPIYKTFIRCRCCEISSEYMHFYR